MTLQQLRYVLEIVRQGSISRAASELFMTQPSLSKAITELEQEMGITIFRRTNRGVLLSEEGIRFLSYARQVVAQADLLESRYHSETPVRHTFSLSSQHYAIVVAAFADLLESDNAEHYDFYLRETMTYSVIEDVHLQKSDLGILYESSFNKTVLHRLLNDNDLTFTPMFTVKPHVFIRRKHPLAAKKTISLADLKPYPRLLYDQGTNNSFYLTEEVHSTESSDKNIYVTDRGTIFNLLVDIDGYTIGSGILSNDFSGSEIVSRPLETDEYMKLGAISQKGTELRGLSQKFIELLKARYEESEKIRKSLEG